MNIGPEIINTIPDTNIFFWVYSSLNNCLRYINPGANRILEVDITEIIDIRLLKKVVHPEDWLKVFVQLNGGPAGSTAKQSYRVSTADGSVKWLENAVISVQGKDVGSRYVIGCTYPGSKNRKPGLSTNYPFNSGILTRSFPDSFLVVDPTAKIIKAQIGKNERDLLAKSGSQRKAKTACPALNGTLVKKIKEKLKDYSTNKNFTSFEIETKINSKRNWFEVRMFKIERNTTLVTIHNITALLFKINEIEKFYNITEQSEELVMITDVTGTIEYVNPMFIKISGYNRNELIGKKASIFKSGKHPETFYVNLWRTILKGKPFKTEFINARKNRTFYIEEKIITPLVNPDGEITNFISTGRDVTLERRNEQKANKYKQLEVTIQEKEQKSRTLSLIKSNEIERKNFAWEIHEGVNQMLSATMANLESLGAKKVISPEDKTKIEFINQMVFEITQDLRGISTNLSPMTLYEFGLFPVIQQIVRKSNSSNSSLHITFTSNIAGLRFKNEIEINIYRIIQEAVKNIITHAHATKISLSVNYGTNLLELQIKDDGKGINMNNLEFKKMSTFGILNMEARAKSIGALLSIKSGKDKGFMINLSLNTKLKNNG